MRRTPSSNLSPSGRRRVKKSKKASPLERSWSFPPIPTPSSLSSLLQQQPSKQTLPQKQRHQRRRRTSSSGYSNSGSFSIDSITNQHFGIEAEEDGTMNNASSIINDDDTSASKRMNRLMKTRMIPVVRHGARLASLLISTCLVYSMITFMGKYNHSGSQGHHHHYILQQGGGNNNQHRSLTEIIPDDIPTESHHYRSENDNAINIRGNSKENESSSSSGAAADLLNSAADMFTGHKESNNNFPEMILSASSYDDTKEDTIMFNRNAIVYLLRSDWNGKGSSLDRYQTFLKSLDHLYENYLSQKDSSLTTHMEDTHIFIFHTGQLIIDDLIQLEARYSTNLIKKEEDDQGDNINDQERWEREQRGEVVDDAIIKLPAGMIRLVNLKDTKFWGKLPKTIEMDNREHWKDYGGEDENDNFDLSSSDNKARQTMTLNDRHEHRFWSIHVWDYFNELNESSKLNYRYIMRMDPNSLIHSPIKYNIFDNVSNNNYQYSFRVCSPKSGSSSSNNINNKDDLQEVWNEFLDLDLEERPLNDALKQVKQCIMYNTFFIADLQFFLLPKVQRWLHFVDKGGYNYRNNLSSSSVQSMAVYAYADNDVKNVHRFLDFTFESFQYTLKKKAAMLKDTTCKKQLVERRGVFQGGYDDKKNASGLKYLEEWIQEEAPKDPCDKTAVSSKIHTLAISDLSTPQYIHNLPKRNNIQIEISLPTIIIPDTIDEKNVAAGGIDVSSQ